LRQGGEAAVIALGSCVHPALEAARSLERDKGFKITVFDAVWAKPLDEDALCALACEHKALLLVEEHALAGGFSSAVLEMLHDRHIAVPLIRRLGIRDVFVEQDSQSALRAQAGLDAAGVRKNLEELLAMSMTLAVAS